MLLARARIFHQRLRVDAAGAPREGEQIEQAEVEEQDEADHDGPAGEHGAGAEEEAGEKPDDGRTGDGAGGGSDPFMHPRRRNRRGAIEAFDIHAGVGEEESRVTIPRRARIETARPPRSPFARGEHGDREKPHRRPHRNVRADEQRDRDPRSGRREASGGVVWTGNGRPQPGLTGGA
jgi:hypothetical protein